MISSSNIIKLPYSNDLTEGGIAYALHSLAYSYNRAGSSPYEKLRRTVANTAVEIAFRRYLSQKNTPFEVQSATPFTDSERYDVSLAGKRCDIKSYLISRREQIQEMRNKPEILLNTSALIPSDQHAREGHKRDDLYIFAFLAGLTAASQADLKKVIAKGQPHYLIHVMPEEWRKPVSWNPLGKVTLKSESEEEMIVEVNGQDSAREMKRAVLSLPPKVKVSLDDSFYSITAIHVRQMPTVRVGIHCEKIKDAVVISALEWGNIWVYGLEMFFVGYISYEEFSQKAKPLAINSRTFQYEHTKVKNLAMSISELKALSGLFEKKL